MDNNELNTATTVASVAPVQPAAPIAPANADEKESKLTNKKIVLDEDPVYTDVKVDDDEALGIIGKNGPAPASYTPPVSAAPATPTAASATSEGTEGAVQTGNITF